MRRRFHQFVMIYRLGVFVFAALLFIRGSSTRTALAIATTPCALSLFSTAVFVSTDILWLLARSYEFWFLVIINGLNWVLLAFILRDVRVLPCFSAWLAFQTVTMIDANYRTYPTALSSTIVSSPLVAAIAGLVAARRVRDAHYFEVHINNHFIGDAADLISFTSFTLVLFLVRIVVLKKTRIHRTFNGSKGIPCVVIRATLRLLPLEADVDGCHRQGITESPTRRVRGHTQQLILSSLPLTHVDARRTILPHRIWKQPPQWIVSISRQLRVLFYSVGAMGLSLLLAHTLAVFWCDWEKSGSHQLKKPRTFGPISPWSSLLVSIGSLLSITFCGCFVLFYQRDLFRALLRNFDFLFSATQSLTFAICHCDLHDWDFERTVNVLTWSVWFLWTLTLDTLTPVVKHRVFRFQKRFAAPVLASIIFGTAAIGLFILFVPGLGYHNRDVWRFRFSEDAVFTVRTESLLLGRVVTIVLWCTRQAFLLLTRKDDELNLIHGSVEYLSPYCTFPSIRATTVAVINQRDSKTRTHLFTTAELLAGMVRRSLQIHVGPRHEQTLREPLDT